MPNSVANNPHLPFTVGQFIASSVTRLKLAEIDGAEADARILVSHGLKLDRAALQSQSERLLTEKELRGLSVYVECRAKHMPVARILGRREFWSLSFELNEATLVPRPDSETLIEATLKHTDKKSGSLRILDLGTGTGCLLISLLHELPEASGLGIDLAPRATEQARKNAQGLGLEGRAAFQTNNWLQDIDETFDIIISNPPYISKGDIKELMVEVRDHDPLLALDGGEDGLSVYKEIIPKLPKNLKPKGIAVFEVGQGQAGEVGDLFWKNGFLNITTYKDFGGIERCVLAHMP